MATKNGIIQSDALSDAMALIYAVNQTHQILTTIKEAK